MNMSSDKAPPSTEEFDWIQLNKDLASHRGEGFAEKFMRKVWQNPFVPIGALGAAGALTYGLISMRKNDSRMSQLMMRTRIGAQAFCVVALIVGIVVSHKRAQ